VSIGLDKWLTLGPMARFAPRGKVRDVFVEAGAMAPAERLVQFKIEAPISVEDFWSLRMEMSEVFREKIGSLSTHQANEVKRRALDAFREYSTTCGISFPGEVLIVSASKNIPV
jgi:hypothetical protein